ncbi:MAG TPA: polysaccharide biosynthesis/export family protein [Chitinophagaceae bacterium]
MKLTRTLLLFVFPLYLFSCRTPKEIPPNYLEKLTDSSGHGIVVVPEMRIQKNDILSIQVYSATTKREVDELYNLMSAPATPSLTTGGGILVDSKGNIEYPRLGTFHAEGLTKDELAAQIKKRLTEPVELLKDPIVIIRYLNLKVTVLGEVGNQGMISIPGERVTILEALGLAGGITDYGRKTNVKVVRELDGKRQIGIVDLSSDSLFHSPYYNLQQNDVVMIEPTTMRERERDELRALQRASFLLSVITAAALIYNIFQ